MSGTPEESGNQSLGVRFAESAIGRPIVATLLFIANSFWLSLATVSLLVFLASLLMGDTVIAGITATFGLSGVFVGVLGYVTYVLYARTRDSRTPGSRSSARETVRSNE